MFKCSRTASQLFLSASSSDCEGGLFMANQRNSLLVLSKLRKSDQPTSAFHLHTSHSAMMDLKLQKPVCINLTPTPTPSPLTQLKLKGGQNLWKADQQLGRPQPPREPASGKLVLASEGRRHWQLEPSWSSLQTTEAATWRHSN